MTELWQMGALELAAKIGSKEASSREVLHAHLARVDQVNGHLNAIVRVLADEALAAAEAADAAVAAGDELGPLHGVPCTVKENIDLAGTPTTQAVSALKDAVASIDAPTTARMRAAGAIPFARTNLPDFGLRVHTDSELHGLTRNPWNPNVTAGGSSGGEGSALASGMSPIGLGNDIGGSLRNPASCCGIASIKPSTGVVPQATVIPPIDQPLAPQLMAVEGPMSRRIADVRAGFEILAGPDRRDPVSLPVVLTDATAGERMRIAVLAEPPGGAIDPGISAAIRSVGDRLADAGHEVIEATPPGYEEVLVHWAALLGSEVRQQKEMLDLVMGPGGRAVIASFDEELPPNTLTEQFMLHAERYRLMREWSEFYAEHPVMICPTWALASFAHDADIDGSIDMTETIRPVLPANFLGTPSVVTPAGVLDGLPVGVQVMGDRFTDLRCLTVAAEIESLVGTLTPIDPITS
jgi:amidase